MTIPMLWPLPRWLDTVFCMCARLPACPHAHSPSCPPPRPPAHLPVDPFCSRGCFPQGPSLPTASQQPCSSSSSSHRRREQKHPLPLPCKLAHKLQQVKARKESMKMREKTSMKKKTSMKMSMKMSMKF